MQKSSAWMISCALLGALACGSPAPAPAPKQAAKSNKEAAKPAEPAAKQAEPKPVEPPVEPPAEPATDPAVEPPADPAVEPPTDPAVEPPTEAPAEAPANPSGGWTPPADADIRSDAVVPPGTPTANAEAFKKLPKTKADGPPVSAIASNGLHFDTLVLGRGWEKSRCQEPTKVFKADSDDKVNICVRVVHPSDVAEELSVEWTKQGAKTTRRSKISVKAMHAYLTRGYLPIKPGYEGEWTATVKAPDGTVLATLPFTVE